MSNPFTSRATALGQTAFLDGGGDRVPDGAHWRITLPANSIPAGPVLVFPAYRGTASREHVLGGRNPDGTWPTVEPESPLYISIHNLNSSRILAWALVDADEGLRVAVIDTVAAPNGEHAEIAARTSKPFALAVADMQMIRVTGKGKVRGVQLFSCPQDLSDALGGQKPVDATCIAQETADQLDDYIRATVADEYWKDRVNRSAPKLALPYDPAGPDRAVTKGDESDRIESLVGADQSVASWVSRAYAALRNPIAASLAQAADPSADDLAPASLTYDALAALHTACLDPGIARWLGLSGTFPNAPDQGYQMYVAVVPVYRRVLGNALTAPALPAVSGKYDSLTDDAYDKAVKLAQKFPTEPMRRWRVEMLAVPLPAAIVPPDRPAKPSPVAVRTAWRADTVPPQPQTWIQTIALDDAVPTGSVSLVSTEPSWRSMHSMTAGQPNRMIAGWPDASQKAKRNPVVIATGLPTSDDPDVSDETTFEVRLGDWVGRWSEPGDVTSAPPRRPAPPPPAVAATIVRTQPPPTGTAPASAGTVAVVMTVPASMAPGSYPIASVHLGGDLHGDVPLTAAEGRNGGVKRMDFPAPKTVPGHQRALALNSWTVDAGGTASALPNPAFELQASDPRPVRAPTIAPRLLVCTRRTNDPTVSITLEIEAPHGVTADAVSYRFLIATETTLRAHVAGLGNAGPTTPRTVRAKQLVDAGGGQRLHYSWAVDKPVKVVGGKARARIDLPSGTSDVVLVKAVPMVGPKDPQGEMVESVSTPFGAIPAVAVVVPISDVPPIPRLGLYSPAAGGITVAVSVTGVDRTILGRLNGPIQARLVEVVDPTGDPAFWPEVTTTSLADAGNDFTASISIAEVPPWTRVGLATAVRFPPENTTLAGAVVPNPELRAAGVQPERITSPWGPYSVPQWIEVVGPEPVLQAGDDLASVSVSVTGLTEIPAGQPQWQVAFLSGSVALTTQSVTPVTAASPVAVLGPPAVGTSYAAQLIDPFGIARTPVAL